MSQDKLIVISDIAAENLVELGIPRANCLSLGQFLEGTKKNSMPHLFILESSQLAQKDVLDAISKVPFYAVALTYEEELFMQPMVADDIISHFLPKPVNSKILRSVISSVLESVGKDQKIVEIEQKLKQESRKLKELNEIGKSLSSIADPYILMNLILRKSRELTNADAGSVCVIKYDNEGKPSRLLFSYFQNETLKQDAKVNLVLLP